MKKKIVQLTTCILVVALVVTVLVSMASFRGTYTNDVIAVLKGNINAMELSLGDRTDYQEMADEYQKAYGQNNRITIIAEDGTVLADTQADSRQTENHLERPEVQQALAGGFGTAVRYSETTGKDMIYVAKQMPDGIIVRNSMPLANATAVVNQTLPVIIIVFILLVVLAVFLSGKIVGNTLKPFRQLYDSIQGYIDGKQKTLSIESPYPEFDDMAQAFSRISERLNRYIERVKLENRKTALIIDSINEGLMILDEKEDVLLINTAAKNIFGVEGEPLSENILHYTRRPDIVSKLEKSLAKKKNMQFEARDDETGRTYRFYTSIVDEPAFINGEGGHAMLVLISDVTDIELSERVRRDFAANVSHELKTPLTSINGFAQLVANGMVSDEDSIKDYARRISKESDRLMGLINDTLMLSELEQISIDEAIETVDITKVTEDVLHLLEDHIVKRKLDVHVAGTATMMANKNRIRELMLNLCDNAIKYNKEGGTIDIRLSEQDDFVEIEVQDTGIGVPEDEVNRIFERFYRAKNSGGATVSGTGLGLAIVKHIVALYDGELTMESHLGEGSRFIVRMKKD
ncbi:sensor histidine kinase [Christensenella intestinihominis]|uniref:sensor histidine kinase n=1 Tax=Christensenella intestinihominis TaxID=1851429 RepID=UPI00082DC878|nr:ATP-binding protein [Christensenella intestinihominis]